MTNLAAASIKSTGGSLTRTLGDRFADVINAKDFGAIGNGIADDTAALQAAINVAFNQPSGNGNNWHLNKPLFIPAGDYKTSAPLTIRNTWGAHVFGASLTSTQIRNETRDGTGEAVIALNGVGYSLFENIRLMAAAGCIALDYNWDFTGLSGQLNTFYKMIFGSIGGHGLAAYGCRVGAGGQQCDTSSWIDCLFGADIGVAFLNQNAISHRIMGGNFQGCRIGIYAPLGAVQEIAGVGFQQSAEWDIRIEGGNGDPTHVSGVSTESPNFLYCSTLDCAITIIGCGQRWNSDGVFAGGSMGVLSIEGCMSKAGTVGSGRLVTIKNSQFWRIDAVDAFTFYPTSMLRLENTCFGLDVGSIARREIDTIVTSAGRRQRGVEGTSLTADSVANGGVWNGGNLTTFPNIAISLTSPATFSSTSWTGDANRHGFKAGTVIAFTTIPNGDTLPTGVVVGTAYYVLATGLTAYTFRLSASPGGAAINCSGTQSGSHSIYLVRMYAKGDTILKNDVAASSSPGWVCTTAGHTLLGTGAGAFKTLPNVGA